MSDLNLGVRFLFELVGIAALGWWGWSSSGDTLPRVGLAILAPVVLIVLWAIVVAPKADNPIPGDVRVLIGTVFLLVAAGTVALAGRAGLAAVVAVAIIVNTVLIFALRRPEA